MSSDPRELAPLLAKEIERHLPVFERPDAGTMDQRAALHALRGSAAMAGSSDLALVLGQLGARLKAGDASARGRIVQVLREVSGRLAERRPAFTTSWPEPPEDLRPAELPPEHRAEYRDAMRDRLAELDDALGGNDDDAILAAVTRTVHAMKGAALALGDDTFAWYLHGLEGELRTASKAPGRARAVLDDLTRHRFMMSSFLDDPHGALERLRSGDTSRGRNPGEERVASSPEAPRPKTLPPEVAHDEGFLRVSSLGVDRVLDRLERARLLEEELHATAEETFGTARSLRSARGLLQEALRLIGPPKPWGAPAAALQKIQRAAATLWSSADGLDATAATIRHGAEELGAHTQRTTAEISALRKTTVRWLFDRVANAVATAAASEQKLVRVEIEGADLPIDRRVADRLVDPLLQLAHNAVAHGIRPPAERVAAGKDATGSVSLRAEAVGDFLRLTLADDGAGVDWSSILRSASWDVARQVGDDDPLAILFLPGLTTREGTDLLAGRGVGLDFVRGAVQKLGGTVRLGTQRRGGLVATLEVPSHGSMAEVLWLFACDVPFALPVGFAGVISTPDDSIPTVHLGQCVGMCGPRAGRLAVELSSESLSPIRIAVDGVGAIEEVTIRPVPSLVGAAGPYSGAILGSHGALRLVVDATRLAASAWTAAH